MSRGCGGIASRPHPNSGISVVYERKQCFNWLVVFPLAADGTQTQVHFKSQAGKEDRQ
jgi:hypothetical protein